MLKNYLLLFLLGLTSLLTAQVVTSEPAIPKEDQQVVITFYADRGTAGLKDYSGDVYAHTGVITDKSTSGGDWKYAPTWGDNSAKYKLTRVSANQYTLSISPDIRTYYGVPAGEKILQMAFVFRSGDSSREGKDDGGKDIYVDLSDGNLSVAFASPQNRSIVNKGANVEVNVNAAESTNIKLFVNDVEVTSTATSSLQHVITNVQLDKYTLRAEATDGTNTVNAESMFFVKGDVVTAPRPANLRRGVNWDGGTSATVLLYAPNKNYVYLVGDFNNWEPTNSSMMKKDGNYFWLTIDNLELDTEYAYQFWMDGNLKLADPYTNKVLDPWNDKYIPASIYPNLKAYPEEFTENIVSVFNTNTSSFQWDATGFNAPKKEDLVIYEVLIRDFTANKDIKTITDTLPYLKRLGVNAIELMPFNEFEGNESWGYNPSFYFAADKAYGTANDYKAFINECHKNGMAVIMDMVLNHSFSQSPLAQMYMQDGKPASNNPWYNREHNMKEPAAQWGFDFNHESAETKALVDSVCAYWMSEYKVDGFRFDFTKGFTNTSYPVGDWASAYDASRITILKRMANEVWKRNPKAYVIFEHLSENSEERELANYGIMMWGNANHNFNEATMGYNENNKSDLSWTSYVQRGWNNPHLISYMESHDEERLMYRNIKYGSSNAAHDTRDRETALRRMEAATVIFLSIPGPKMIWQFGEMGFEYSINRCTDGTVSDNCRLSPKPPVWEYQQEENRMKLFEVYKHMINAKVNEEVFETKNFTMDVSGAVKKVALNMNASDVRVVANFGMEKVSVSPNFSSTGVWYNHFGGNTIDVTDVNMELTLYPGKYLVLSQKPLTGYEPGTSVDKPDAVQPTAQLYPNPMTNTVTVSSSLEGKKQVELISMSGSRMKMETFDGEQASFNWTDVPAGHYIVRVTNGNEVVVTKLIKR